MKMTPWFPPEIRPVHVGEYEVRSVWNYAVLLRWFDGEFWSCVYSPDEPKEMRIRERQYVSAYQEITWRGLAKEPK